MAVKTKWLHVFATSIPCIFCLTEMSHNNLVTATPTYCRQLIQYCLPFHFMTLHTFKVLFNIYTQCWKGSSEEKKVQWFLLLDYDLGIKKELKMGKSEMKSWAILEGWWYTAIKFCHIWAELAVCVRWYLHDGSRFFFIHSNFELLLYPKIIIKQ